MDCIVLRQIVTPSPQWQENQKISDKKIRINQNTLNQECLSEHFKRLDRGDEGRIQDVALSK